jgi:hypothetical protein
MRATSATHGGSSSTGSSALDTLDTGQARTGPFVLTLCSLQGPVSIRPPQSPQLRRFTFFTSTASQSAGGDRVYLHMGYFQTLTDAERLLQAVRRRFPQAIATQTRGSLKGNAAAPAPHAEEALTDTQVMSILETRGTTPAQGDLQQRRRAEIGLLRPEDTSTRRALKEAVVEGAPVYFAVQLDWSARPIGLDHVPSLPVLRTHTLYTTESRREGRCRYFLRWGFFTDAASAKEAAFQLRSKFASAVVVPVTDEEMTRAHEGWVDPLGFAQRSSPLGAALDLARGSMRAAKPNRTGDRSRKSPQDTETLEQTLETLAEQETWNDPDSLSESGVRHLRIEVQKGRTGRS